MSTSIGISPNGVGGGGLSGTRGRATGGGWYYATREFSVEM